jgi:myo-inositol 2-dehydrogenase / D-chiro-inositol 1-dehydrogenase
MNAHAENPTTRRQFLKSSTAAVVGGAVAAPFVLSNTVRGATSEKLKIGFIGCGGRGTGAASQALNADSNIELYAMGDVFQDRIDTSLGALKKAAPDKINCPAERQFIGLDAYKKVIASGVDVVILTTPPGFRPMHFKHAIEMNKHVFLEKPMATDAPGLRSVMATVQIAKQKKLAVVAGFCLRYDYARREFYKRVHGGELGEIRALYDCYWGGPVKVMPPADTRKPGVTDLEWQLRNWYNFVWICGDGLVEQGVHGVDKIAWAMKDTPPLKCVAVGGRQVPNPGTQIFDHIEVNYEWANGVRAFMGHRQQSHCHSKAGDYVMGTKGIGTIATWVGERSQPTIEGATNWTYTGEKNNMYQTEHDEFFNSIRKGEPINDGDRMCTSTMIAIMGRMAAYTGQEITWEQALNSKEDLFPANIDWNMKLEPGPMAVPGVTKFS